MVGPLSNRLNRRLGVLLGTVLRTVLNKVLGGDASSALTISSLIPRIITLPEGADFIDFDVRGGDVFLLFGDSAVSSIFDPILCKYHAHTYESGSGTLTGFDVEPIGVPAGATHVAVLAAQGTTTTLQMQVVAPEDFAGYGGARQDMVFTAIGARYWTLGTPLAVGTDFTACWEGTIGSVGDSSTARTMVTIAAAETGATGVITPQFRMSKSATDHLFTVVQSNAVASDSTHNDDGDLVQDERVLFCAKYNASTKVTTLLRYSQSMGPRTGANSASASGLNVDPLAVVILGANAAGAQAHVGIIRQFMLVEGLVPDQELFSMYGPKAPPMPYLLTDRTKVREYIAPQANRGLVSWVTNRAGTLATGSTAGNMTLQTTTDPTAAFIPNRLLAQTASTVKNTGYTETETADASGNALGLGGMHIVHAHHALKLDVGASPDPDNATATTIPAGTSLVGMGPGENVSLKNSSGSASDTGQMNAIGVTFVHPEGVKSWQKLIADDKFAIDFEEVYNGGPEWLHTSWRDPNITDPLRSHWTVYLTASGGPPEVDPKAIYIGFRNPFTGGWLDPSTDGRDILVDNTNTGIGDQVKAFHCGLENDEIVIGGVDNEGVGDHPMNPYIYRVTARDGEGRPTTFSRTLVGDIQDFDPNLKRMVNPLISQASVADCGSTACCFVASMTCVPDIPANLTTDGIGYMVTGEGVLRIVANTNADDRASFRLPRRTPYILTAATTGIHEGKMQLTNWATHEHIVIETDQLHVGQGGSFFAFDPQGWVMPDGRLWLVSQTEDQQHLYWYRPLGDDPDDGYETYAITNLATSTTPIGDWYSMSPEPVFQLLTEGLAPEEITNDDLRVTMLYTVKDVNDQFTGPSRANRTEIWDSAPDDTHERVDFQALDAGAVDMAHHESEWWMGEPDPEHGGRVPNFFDMNFVIADPGSPSIVTNRIAVCNTGRYSEVAT